MMHTLEEIMALRRSDNGEAAMTALREFLAVHPGDVNGTVLMGEMLFERGDVEGARRTVAQALERGADNTWALRVMGTIAAAQGDFDEAEKSLTRAIAVEDSPNRAWSYLELAGLHRKRGDTLRARENFEKALDLYPGSPEIRTAYRDRDLPALYRLYNDRRHDRGPGGKNDAELLWEAMEFACSKDDRFIANWILNERETAQKRTLLASQVRSLHVALTARCNQRCRYCSQVPSANGEGLSDRSCDAVREALPYLRRITWQGGEAFLHPRFGELVAESLKNPYLEHTLVSNGQFLNETWLDLFSRAKTFDVVIPLQSLRKEVYEDLCAGGSFDVLMRNIDLVRGYKEKHPGRFGLFINMIMMRRNYTELEDVALFAVEKGFSQVIITHLYDNGTGFYEREYLSPEDPEVRKHFSDVLPRVEESLRKNGIQFSNRFIRIEPDRQGDGSHRPEPASGPVEPRCLAPWQQLFIEPNEEVRCNGYCPVVMGDLRRNSLKEIWNGETIVRVRENLLARQHDFCNPVCTGGTLEKES